MTTDQNFVINSSFFFLHSEQVTLLKHNYKTCRDRPRDHCETCCGLIVILTTLQPCEPWSVLSAASPCSANQTALWHFSRGEQYQVFIQQPGRSFSAASCKSVKIILKIIGGVREKLVYNYANLNVVHWFTIENTVRAENPVLTGTRNQS